MTNLLAAITIALVTNTTERFPTHPFYCGDYITVLPNGTAMGDGLAHYRDIPDANPTEKWKRTTVTEVTTVTFTNAGVAYSATNSKVISDTETHYVLKQEWLGQRAMETQTPSIISLANGPLYTNYTDPHQQADEWQRWIDDHPHALVSPKERDFIEQHRTKNNQQPKQIP